MVTSTREQLWAELAGLCGIEPHYYDIGGRLRTTSPQTQAAILAAMGQPVESVEAMAQEIERRLRQPWSELVPPVLALFRSQLHEGWSLYLPLPEEILPGDLEITWELWPEGEQSRTFGITAAEVRLEEVRRFGDEVFGRVVLPLPGDLALGYYDLDVRAQSSGLARQGRMRLVIAPPRVYVPQLLEQRRLWGLTLPLYAVASQRNWGIGDLGDLRELLTLAHRVQADVVGLNPLHHLGVHLDDSISPYYPASRSFANLLHLDLEGVPELALSSPARDFLGRAEVQDQLARLRQARRVRYPEVAQLKAAILPLLLEAFLEHHGWPASPRSSRGREFADYLEAQGELLQQFATFIALSDHWRDRGEPYLTWQEWPEAYHHPRGPAVAEFARSRQRQVLAQAYAQWLLASQLQEIQAEARQRQMGLGLNLDLAVGVNPGGFDTWAQQPLFALNCDIGAPPDDFSPLGQNWGLAPLLPQALRDQGYRYFMAMLRNNCLPGGALRIDHVMGLFRLYWIPRGLTAAQGAYVRYPAEELLKIVALESARQQTLIIGEDLGTVAPSVREELQKYQVLSTRLFYFERQGDGAFNQAQDYPPWAQASVTTHDLPTLAGFWQGRDIAVRQELNLFPDAATAGRAWEERRLAKAAILTLLEAKGELSPEAAAALAQAPELPEQVKWLVLEHLAQTPCRLALLSLEDIFGWLDQQNLPGTKDEYPNWRLKFPLTLEEMVQAAELAQAGRIMGRYRGREGRVEAEEAYMPPSP